MADAKSQAYEQVSQIPFDDTHRNPPSADTVHTSQHAWTPTIWQIGPFSGIIAIIIALSCMAASLLILFASDGDLISAWDVQPSVFLSTADTIIAKLLGYAFVTAIPIAWWSHAIKGRSLAYLEKEWEAGDNLFGALGSVRYFGPVTAATLCCALLVVTGPFLQKASVVVEAVPADPIKVTVWISPQLPRDWSGEMTDSGGHRASVELEEAYQGFIRGGSISPRIDGCPGICRAAILGPGLSATSCAEVTIPVDMDHRRQWPQIVDDGSPDYVLLTSLIAAGADNRTWWGPSNFTKPKQLPVRNPTRESISIYTEYAQLKDGRGAVTISQCWLVSAVLEYTVSIRDHGRSLTLDSPADAKLVSLSDNTKLYVPIADGPDRNVTILALGAKAGISYYNTNLTFWVEENDSQHRQGLAPFLDQFLDLNSSSSDFIDDFMGVNPTSYIIAGLNEIMFRGGILAAANDSRADTLSKIDQDLPIRQNVQAAIVSNISMFQTSYRW